jgi:hypothetical protein
MCRCLYCDRLWKTNKYVSCPSCGAPPELIVNNPSDEKAFIQLIQETSINKIADLLGLPPQLCSEPRHNLIIDHAGMTYSIPKRSKLTIGR